MADISNHKKRKRPSLINKLLIGDKVEVKSVDDGFQGSWHPGKIIGCETGFRKVQYDNLLADNESDLLIEKVEFSCDENTTASKNCDRRRIRPSPLDSTLTKQDLHYGVCVDCYYNEAWWEGVVFDNEDGSSERNIFFPDLGDELRSNIKHLRLTHDWNKVTGEWTRRGDWYFLQIMEEYEKENKFIPVSFKQIWYDMKAKEEFSEIGEWPFPVQSLLQQLVEQVVDDNMRLTLDALLKDEDWARGNEDAFTMVGEISESAELTVVDLHESNPANNQVLPVQPKALSMICSDLKGLVSSSIPEAEVELHSNLISVKAKPKRRIKQNFLTDNNELSLESEFCQKSLYEYLLAERPSPNLTKNVRSHLLALGYKMQYRENSNCICYKSPRGKKYYHLRDCVKFEKKLVENSSLAAEDIQSGTSLCLENPNRDPQSVNVTNTHAKCSSRKKRKVGEYCSPEADILGGMKFSPKQLKKANTSGMRAKKRKVKVLNVDVESKYCPEAIPRYLTVCKKRGMKFFTVEVDEARGHLSAIGWKFWLEIRNGREQWRYEPPTANKTHYSLKSACEAVVEDKEMHGEDSKGLSGGLVSFSGDDVRGVSFSKRWSKKYLRALRKFKAGKCQRRKPNGYAHSMPSLLNEREQDGANGLAKRSSIRRLSTSFVCKKKKALGKVKNSSQVLRSSKRAQAEPSSSSQVPWTVLSWLIDNNVVSAREKVQYFKEGDDNPKGEGRITNFGINCSCCSKIYTLSGFEAHVGCYSHRPAANLFFCRDEKSLTQRQLDLMSRKVSSFTTEPVERTCGKKHKSWNDHICSICHYGGELILCDRCPSSFHARCLELQGIPEGDWFCPSCCCEICKESHFDNADTNILTCHQCERQYHAHCVRNKNMVELDDHSTDNWFCCKMCEKVHWGLQQLLGKPILVGQNNLTWTLIKPMDYLANDCDAVAIAENFSKLSVALGLMHECFEPVKEPRTQRDLVEDVIFCRGSHLNRLNFKGFYTVLLERNDELITVAILRVYGDKVAEIPLIGTQFKHRRLGMCRIVMEEIEKNLIQLGVKRLVLPAATSVLETWTTAFGFTPVNKSERSEFLSYCFLDFQDTTMCQKFLRHRPSPLPQLSRDAIGIRHRFHRNSKVNSIIPNPEGNSAISEVSQEDTLEGSETVDQGALMNGVEEKSDCDKYSEQDAHIAMMTGPSNLECEPCYAKEQKIEGDGNIKMYKRKKDVDCEANCPKVENSC